jgi:hypothetical protein
VAQVSNEQIGDLLNQVKEGVRNSIRDVFNAATDPAGLIRDGAAGSAYNGLGVEAVRGVCRAWGSGKHPLGGIPAVDNFYGSLCKPYLESINAWPGDGTLTFPTFSGGQCSTVYSSYASGTTTSSNTGATTPFNDALGMQGPVLEWFYFLDGTSLKRRYRDSNFPNGTTSVVRNNVASFNISQTIVRNDGQPDNCGDLPVDYSNAPGEPIDPGADEPVNIPGPYGDFDINVSFGDDGDIILCPPNNVDVPCVSIPGPSEPKGPQNPINPGPHSPNDQGEPGTPQLTGDGGAASGEAPEDSILVGVRVELVNAQSPARPDVTTNGTFYRGALYCYLGSDNGLDLQPEGAIVKFPQFFYAPEVSTKWNVIANLGYSLRVIPYFRRVDS